MLESSARRPRAAPMAALVAVLTAALLVAGCASEKKPASRPSPPPIAELDTAAMQVPRIEFCAQVPRTAVRQALDDEVARSTSYGNGDEEELPGIGEDVVHELGCSWTGKDGAVARAWVFARPVDARFARTVIASGARAQGCRTVRGPAFGSPSWTQVCRSDGGERRVRHAGLFGQTWLTCEVTGSTGPVTDLRARTDRWCVQVVSALDTTG